VTSWISQHPGGALCSTWPLHQPGRCGGLLVARVTPARW
jgi:hypothetical protein